MRAYANWRRPAGLPRTCSRRPLHVTIGASSCLRPLSSGVTTNSVTSRRFSPRSRRARACSFFPVRQALVRRSSGRPASRAEERFGSILTCRGVEAEASLAFAGLSDLLGSVLVEAGPSLAPPRRRALEIALMLAEPGEVAPDPHAIGLAVLDILRVLDRAGAGAGRARRRAVARPGFGRGAADRASTPERRADRPARDCGRLAELGEPFELERAFPDGRLERILARPVEPRRRPQPPHGAAGPRSDSAGARPRPGGDGGQSLLRARAGTRARPNEHEADAGRALPMPESLHELLSGRLDRLPTQTAMSCC